MDETPDNRELAHRIELLKKDFDVLKADIAAKLDENKGAMDRLRADMAKNNEDVAKRETRLILTMGGMIAIAVAILGILIRWPVPPT